MLKNLTSKPMLLIPMQCGMLKHYLIWWYSFISARKHRHRPRHMSKCLYSIVLEDSFKFGKKKKHFFKQCGSSDASILPLKVPGRKRTFKEKKHKKKIFLLWVHIVWSFPKMFKNKFLTFWLSPPFWNPVGLFKLYLKVYFVLNK